MQKYYSVNKTRFDFGLFFKQVVEDGEKKVIYRKQYLQYVFRGTKTKKT